MPKKVVHSSADSTQSEKIPRIKKNDSIKKTGQLGSRSVVHPPLVAQHDVETYRARCQQYEPLLTSINTYGDVSFAEENKNSNNGMDLLSGLPFAEHISLKPSEVLNSADPICLAIAELTENNVIGRALAESERANRMNVTAPKKQQQTLCLLEGQTALNKKNARLFVMFAKMQTTHAFSITKKHLETFTCKHVAEPQRMEHFLDSPPSFLRKTAFSSITDPSVIQPLIFHLELAHLMTEFPNLRAVNFPPSTASTCFLRETVPSLHSEETCLTEKTVAEIVRGPHSMDLLKRYTHYRDRQSVSIKLPACFQPEFQRVAYITACIDEEKQMILNNYIHKRSNLYNEAKSILLANPEKLNNLTRDICNELIQKKDEAEPMQTTSSEPPELPEGPLSP